MRVLVDARHLASGPLTGVGRYTLSLLQALGEIDTQNQYMLLSAGCASASTVARQRVRPLLDHTNISHIHLPVPNKILNLRTLLLSHSPLNWIGSKPIDLLFLPNLNIVRVPKDIPTVLTVHDLTWRLYPHFYSRKMQLWHRATQPTKLIAHSRAVIVPSQSTKYDLERLFASALHRPHIIPHGVCRIFHRDTRPSDHGLYATLKLPKRFVLFVGTIEPRKNLLALIEGVKAYRESTHDDLHVVLVGAWGWKSDPVRRRIGKGDVHEWVHHRGYVDGADLPAVYRAAQATLFPSIYEGFGLPILESLASGTPVITSHTSSMPEVGGDACVYVDPYNSRDICDALRGIMTSSSLRKLLQERGLKQVQRFTWERTAQKTLEVFQFCGYHKKSRNFLI